MGELGSILWDRVLNNRNGQRFDEVYRNRKCIWAKETDKSFFVIQRPKFSAAGLGRLLAIWDRDYSAYLDQLWKQSGKMIRQAYMTDLLQALIEDGAVIHAVEFQNGWLEFDTNEDYANVLVAGGRVNTEIDLTIKFRSHFANKYANRKGRMI